MIKFEQGKNFDKINVQKTYNIPAGYFFESLNLNENYFMCKNEGVYPVQIKVVDFNKKKNAFRGWEPDNKRNLRIINGDYMKMISFLKEHKYLQIFIQPAKNKILLKNLWISPCFKPCVFIGSVNAETMSYLKNFVIIINWKSNVL